MERGRATLFKVVTCRFENTIELNLSGVSDDQSKVERNRLKDSKQMKRC